MDTSKLKRFAQEARRQLMAQVSTRMTQILNTDSAELRGKEAEISKLRQRIAEKSKDYVIEEAAYIWFNRLVALRFMDVNHYTDTMVVSPHEGHTQPVLLQDAKEGVFSSSLTSTEKSQVLDLLSGHTTSMNPEQEAYQILLIAECNHWAEQMGFLFEKLTDYTKLLIPEDLLSQESILHSIREALTEDTCENVEVIGWLYQFYISERKADIDKKIKKGKKVEKDELPAKTQLFTPDWIVQYMVQNSLGRLWMLNHPQSNLIAEMEYYIQPEDGQVIEFLKITSPEEIKFLDPACGSGHILTYAFELLNAIYEEQGYDAVTIPSLILQKNLYGIELDKRAAQLAGFALMMQARSKDRRFFRRDTQPNILEVDDVSFSPEEINTYMKKLGHDLWTQDVWQGLKQFENVKTYGSLIRPVIRNVSEVRRRMEESGVFNDLFLSNTNENVKRILDMSEYLSSRYHVVVANPPYLGGKNLTPDLKAFAADRYPNSKSDLFAMFIERGFDFIPQNGYNAMVTMQSWMFLSSFEKMRNNLINSVTIECMVHMANMVMGIAFGTNATVWKKQFIPAYKGYFSFVDYKDLGEDGKPFEFPVRNDRLSRASAADFKKIPGAPIAYWVSDRVREVFEEGISLKKYCVPRLGMATGNNDTYLRFWYEPSRKKIGTNIPTRQQSLASGKKWFPYNKGGEYRKWAGNYDYVVNWEEDGVKLRNTLHPSGKRIWAHNFNLDYIFKSGITWTFISSSNFAARYTPEGFLFDVGGSSAFPPEKYQYVLTAFLCSKLSFKFLKALNPTLNFQVGNLSDLPIVEVLQAPHKEKIDSLSEQLISLSITDWNSFEVSWDFKCNPLVENSLGKSLSECFSNAQINWNKIINTTKSLEEENNQIFIDAYGLHDELDPITPISDVTLCINPHYRYAGVESKKERENRFMEDTIKEFISYAVGCMFGRYSLDKPGLVLANQGETLQHYLRNLSLSKDQVTFLPTESNVIPIVEGDWFEDDAATRFKEFLRVTFGDVNFAENLRFIEEALGKDVEKYFLRDFYKDHVQMYKKRPIYWLFSSPKDSFNALIYMHRYQSDTVSVVLNNYLREFRHKLDARNRYLGTVISNPSASVREKTAARKESEAIAKMQAELKPYEDEVLFPLAGRQIEIDLDDGVKENYPKFGKALKKIF